jgi:hypothetical protein
MQFDPMYQNRYMAHPMHPREQDGYAMNGYAPPPPGMLYPILPSIRSSVSLFDL